MINHPINRRTQRNALIYDLPCYKVDVLGWEKCQWNHWSVKRKDSWEQVGPKFGPSRPWCAWTVLPRSQLPQKLYAYRSVSAERHSMLRHKRQNNSLPYREYTPGAPGCASVRHPENKTVARFAALNRWTLRRRRPFVFKIAVLIFVLKKTAFFLLLISEFATKNYITIL